MIKNLAIKMTRVLIDKKIIKKEDCEIYEYCSELAIVSLISYCLLFVIAIIFDEMICSLLFLVVFSLFRRVNGGYHAKNYIRCAIISISCYLFMIFIIKNYEYIFKNSYLLLVVGMLLVVLISPQQDDNKPLTKRQYYLLKFLSKNITTILITLLVLIREYSEVVIFENKFMFSVAYAVDLAAISLLISKLERSTKK